MGRFNRSNFKRGIAYLKRNGIMESVYKVRERLLRDAEEKDYDSYARSVMASEEDLLAQREQIFERNYKISILIPAYETDPDLFIQTLESVAVQSYGNWEICIADASKNDSRRSLVREFCEKWNLKCTDKYGSIYDKVQYLFLNRNDGISANTNEALKVAKGDYIALLDHDDLLEADAFYQFIRAVNDKEVIINNGEVNLSRVYMVYSDEDKIDENNTCYFDWHRKPDFDPVLLCSNNYICHLLFVETNLARGVGGFHSEYDGAQDYDFILRCSESIDEEQIIHIPKVLYHWRSTVNSTAENPNAKLYAYEAGIRAVRDHLLRKGIRAEVYNTAHLGFYYVKYPKIEEHILVMSCSEFEKLSASMPDYLPFNYVLILADRIKATSRDCNDYLLRLMNYKDVGAVTGKIISKNGRIDSAGYDKMKDGRLSPRFKGLNRHFSGYLHRADLQQTVDGFTQDCVLIKKEAMLISDGEMEIKPGYRVCFEPKAVFIKR